MKRKWEPQGDGRDSPYTPLAPGWPVPKQHLLPSAVAHPREALEVWAVAARLLQSSLLTQHRAHQGEAGVSAPSTVRPSVSWKTAPASGCALGVPRIAVPLASCQFSTAPAHTRQPAARGTSAEAPILSATCMHSAGKPFGCTECHWAVSEHATFAQHPWAHTAENPPAAGHPGQIFGLSSHLLQPSRKKLASSRVSPQVRTQMLTYAEFSPTGLQATGPPFSLVLLLPRWPGWKVLVSCDQRSFGLSTGR